MKVQSVCLIYHILSSAWHYHLLTFAYLFTKRNCDHSQLNNLKNIYLCIYLFIYHDVTVGFITSHGRHWQQKGGAGTRPFCHAAFGHSNHKVVIMSKIDCAQRKTFREKRQQRKHSLHHTLNKNCYLNWDRKELHHSISSWGGRSAASVQDLFQHLVFLYRLSITDGL